MPNKKSVNLFFLVLFSILLPMNILGTISNYFSGSYTACGISLFCVGLCLFQIRQNSRALKA